YTLATSLLTPSHTTSPLPPYTTLFRSWTVSRSRQGVDQENKILANQSTINWNIHTGVIEHAVVAGVELIQEQQHSKARSAQIPRSEEHTSELQSRFELVCRLLLDKQKR